MGNWTDRFDPETVDEIKRYEVGEGDFLLAERLAMHKGVESVFGFHVNCLGLGKPYWEKGVYLGDVLDFFDRHGETLIEKRAGSWHGDSTEVAKASECLQKGLAQFGLTLAQARERYGLVPADATAEYICTLDGSREERAFQRAKYSYYDFLDYKDDCYTTVSGYMN